MELRRNIPKVLCKRRESTDESSSTSQLTASTRTTSTPVRTNNPSEDEDSPYFPCSTQEMNEDVDVLWDWNSPQSKPKSIKKKSRKRLNLQHSPKVPFKRHPSNNNEQIKQDFNKLREELRALKAEIAKPDNEESLVLSPREEEVFKREENDPHIDDMIDFDHNVIEELFEDDFKDIFNDDMDEKLLLFSQKIEDNIINFETGVAKKDVNIACSKNLKMNSNNSSVKNFYSILVRNCDNRLTTANPKQLEQKKVNVCNPSVMPRNKTEQKLTCQKPFATSVQNEQVANFQDSEIFNDSFDNVLSQMKDEDLDQLTQIVDIKQYKKTINVCNINKKPKVFPRSLSEDYAGTQAVQMTSGKVEWHRTQSFESCNAHLSEEKLQEIERKRLEAKAKRDAKRRQEIVPPITESSDSPIKCSPDEIEKKRLQALEKLEAKRIQDIIEKKKQEALRRREESRKKNAANVKSSLSTKL